MLNWLGLDPLPPPLVEKSPRGNKSRVWRPTAAERAELRRTVYRRDDFTCCWCGTRIAPDSPERYSGISGISGLTLGHIVDYRFGGPYDPANLRTECSVCNFRNAHMIPPGTPSRQSGVGDGAYGETATT